MGNKHHKFPLTIWPSRSLGLATKKNNMQSKNRAWPMAAQLKRRAGHKGIIGKDEIHFMISMLLVSPGGPEMKPGPPVEIGAICS